MQDLLKGVSKRGLLQGTYENPRRKSADVSLQDLRQGVLLERDFETTHENPRRKPAQISVQDLRQGVFLERFFERTYENARRKSTTISVSKQMWSRALASTEDERTFGTSLQGEQNTKRVKSYLTLNKVQNKNNFDFPTSRRV